MKYVLNPQYVLRHGGNKSFIISCQGYGEKSSICIIHPVYAMMLSFFKGRTKGEIYAEISELFHLSSELVSSQLDKLIDNTDYIECEKSFFPPHLIIEYKDGMKIPPYNYKDFSYKEVDLCMSRLDAPIDIICNLTLHCATSCIYCYANRKGNQTKHMDVSLVESILDQAKELGVIRFKLMGGEIMLYKGWERIVKKSIEYGFQPDISTKKPITEKEIQKWIELGATTDPIQISLDTLIKEHLYLILKVNDPYYDQIKESINLLEKYHVTYVVHTVINRFNDSVEDIRSLATFFKGKKYLKRWMFDAAKCSMYNGLPYKEYKTSAQKIAEIGNYVSELNRQKIFSFKLYKPSVLRDFNKLTKEEKAEHFEKRTMCSGNLNALYILPDGKVTICEELYWHPHFIIGDLKKQTLKEIWNSQKAKDIFYLKQSSIPSDSPCSSCQDFPECRKYKHICWRDTILAYGSDKWYYPDISCPKAPHIEKDIAIE